MQKLFKKPLAWIFGSYIVLCTLVFSILYFYTDNLSRELIANTSEQTMSAISQQLTNHFNTIIELHFSDLDQAARSLQENPSQQQLDETLSYLKESGYGQIALLNENEQLDFLSEETFTPYYKADLNYLARGETDLASGTSSTGEKLALLFSPCSFYNEISHQNIQALVASLPADYFLESLHLDEKDQSDSFIVRSDESFVFSNTLDFQEESFDSLKALISGPVYADLDQSLNEEKDYSGQFYLADKGWIHLYASPLPYSNWSLITLIPYGAIDFQLTNLQHALMAAGLIGLLLLCAGAILVYLYLKKQEKSQLALIEKEKERINTLSARDQMLATYSQNLIRPLDAITNLSKEARENKHPKIIWMNLERMEKLSTYLSRQLGDMYGSGQNRSLSSYTIGTLSEAISQELEAIEPMLETRGQEIRFVLEKEAASQLYLDSKKIATLLRFLFAFLSNTADENQIIQVDLNESLNTSKDKIVLEMTSTLPAGSFSLKQISTINPLKTIVSMAAGTIEYGTDSEGNFSLAIQIEREFIPEEKKELKGTILLLSDEGNAKEVERDQEKLEELGLNIVRADKNSTDFSSITPEQSIDLILFDRNKGEEVSKEIMAFSLKNHIPMLFLSSSHLASEPQITLYRPLFSDEIIKKLQPYLKK